MFFICAVFDILKLSMCDCYHQKTRTKTTPGGEEGVCGEGGERKEKKGFVLLMKLKRIGPVQEHFCSVHTGISRSVTGYAIRSVVCLVGKVSFQSARKKKEKIF